MLSPPGGGWTVLWNQNGNWTQGSIPDNAFKKMQEIVKGGGTLRSIAGEVGRNHSGIWIESIWRANHGHPSDRHHEHRAARHQRLNDRWQPGEAGPDLRPDRA